MVLQINILQNEKGQAPLHAIGFFIEMKRALLLEINSITEKVCAVIPGLDQQDKYKGRTSR